MPDNSDQKHPIPNLEKVQQTKSILDLMLDHYRQVSRTHAAYLDLERQRSKNEWRKIFNKMGLNQPEGLKTDQSSRGSLTAMEIDPPSKAGFHHSPLDPQYSWEQITEFATGSLVKCFGDHYSIYDGRRAPRTPNGDLQLISRVLTVSGTRGEYNQPADLISEYDVSADAWFYTHNSYPVMPYSIYMEIALQPCGFLSTYMGCTLIYPDKELSFRNLDSNATLLREVDLRNRTITARSKLTNVASSAETVIVRFDYELSVDGVKFYEGDTAFGYFTEEAMANQVGLDQGKKTLPWYQEQGLTEADGLSFDLSTSQNKARFYGENSNKPYFAQPGLQLDFLSNVLICENKGNYGLGYIYADKPIDPTDWFYACHFYQDPVMPGSLGVEAILQAMRIFAIQQGLGNQFPSPYFSTPAGCVVWKYRGQIIQTNRLMSIEVHIKQIDEQGEQIVIRADASLWKDGLRIYEITDVAISIKNSK